MLNGGLDSRTRKIGERIDNVLCVAKHQEESMRSPDVFCPNLDCPASGQTGQWT
jgi:hypothetical protein